MLFFFIIIPLSYCVSRPLSLTPDAPGRVQDLELIYNSQSELRLQWTPPSDLPSAVPVSYSVNITNTDSGTVEQVKTVCFYKLFA